jgi:hypothetical protein
MSAARRRRTHAFIIFVFQLLNKFRAPEYTSFTPIVKKRHNRQEMKSLRVNPTVNRLLCLLRKLPEFNCIWLVYV